MKLHGTELKVGDRVWNIIHGWGSLDSINDYDGEFYIQYDIDLYTSHNLRNTEKVFFWKEFEIPKEAYIKPLPKLAVDTKVIVWDNNCNKQKQYFKEFNKNGKIVCFDRGTTSFTAHNNNKGILWDNWELYEEKDK